MKHAQCVRADNNSQQSKQKKPLTDVIIAVQCTLEHVGVRARMGTWYLLRNSDESAALMMTRRLLEAAVKWAFRDFPLSELTSVNNMANVQGDERTAAQCA